CTPVHLIGRQGLCPSSGYHCVASIAMADHRRHSLQKRRVGVGRPASSDIIKRNITFCHTRLFCAHTLLSLVHGRHLPHSVAETEALNRGVQCTMRGTAFQCEVGEVVEFKGAAHSERLRRFKRFAVVGGQALRERIATPGADVAAETLSVHGRKIGKAGRAEAVTELFVKAGCLLCTELTLDCALHRAPNTRRAASYPIAPVRIPASFCVSPSDRPTLLPISRALLEISLSASPRSAMADRPTSVECFSIWSTARDEASEDDTAIARLSPISSDGSALSTPANSVPPTMSAANIGARWWTAPVATVFGVAIDSLM